MSEVWERYINNPDQVEAKEVLTDEHIRQDLLQRIREEVNYALVGLVPTIFLFLLSFAVPYHGMYLFVHSFVTLILIFYAAVVAVPAVDYWHCRSRIRIAVDKKIGMKEPIRIRKGRSFSYFIFKRYGSYRIPGVNYKWSEKMCVNDLRLMEVSYEQDEFYVVLGRKDKILMVYPCKNFEYQNGEDVA